MGLHFNRFSINSHRWINAISTGNFYRIRICLIFLQILQKRWQSKAKSLVFPTTQEWFLYVKYQTPYSTSKFDYLFFIHPVESGFWSRVKCRGWRVEGEKSRVKDKMSRVTNKYSIKVLVYHFRRQISCFFLLPC